MPFKLSRTGGKVHLKIHQFEAKMTPKPGQKGGQKWTPQKGVSEGSQKGTHPGQVLATGVPKRSPFRVYLE